MIGPEDRCFVCGTTLNLHTHHIMYGSGLRKQAQKYGLICKLCGRHHNLSNEGVHFNKALDLQLKKEAQRYFEEKYGHEKYMNIFFRNYLGGEDEQHNARGFLNIDEI